MVRFRKVNCVLLSILFLVAMTGCVRVYNGGPPHMLSNHLASNLRSWEGVEIMTVGYKELGDLKQFVVLTEYPSENDEKFSIEDVRRKIVNLYARSMRYLNSNPKIAKVADDYAFARESLTISLKMGSRDMGLENEELSHDAKLKVGSFRAEIDEEEMIRYTLYNSKEVLLEESLSDAIESLNANDKAS